jgi:hypothetical protein
MPCSLPASGQKAQLWSGKGAVEVPRRRRLLLRLEPLEVCFQIGTALLHLVAQFAAVEGVEGGGAELPPGGAQSFLQGPDITRAEIAIEDLGLLHCAKIPRQWSCME